MIQNMTAPAPARHEVWIFFAAILVLNTAFVLAVGEGLIPKHHFPRGRLVLLGGTLAAVVLLFRGPKALFELIRPLFVWRISPLWFIAAFLLPAVFSALFVIGRAVLTGAPIEILGPGAQLLERDGFLLNILIVALVGEIVWVGYAIRTLSLFHSLRMAAIITGTFWAAWWLPMVIYSVGVTPGLPFFGLWMNMLGIAFFCAFFYKATGSGLVILGMQFCVACSVLAFPVLPNIAGALSYQIYSALYMVLGFLTLTVLLPMVQGRAGEAPAGA